MRERIRVDKVAAFSVVINMLQIAAIVALILLVFFTDLEQQSQGFVEYMVLIAGGVVVVGAFMDIQYARHSVRMHEQAKNLEEAYGQLESLNVVMRAQRHDFMNHLQVVYSLIEMEDYPEAVDYIEKVYGDIQSVSQSLRTANPSINALLKVKFAECERRGIHVDAQITSPWNNLPIQGWEMCRVLGNLIDNAMDAMAQVKNPVLTLQLREELGNYRFRVINNGPPIPKHVMEHIFQSGFTTKRTGQGMGLFIVRSILREAGGDIGISSTAEQTIFEGWFPRTKDPADQDVPQDQETDAKTTRKSRYRQRREAFADRRASEGSPNKSKYLQKT